MAPNGSCLWQEIREAIISMVVRAYLLALALSILGSGPASAAVSKPAPQPELRLNLHDAIEAALDNNTNVRLLEEQIQRAQDIADARRGHE